MHLPRQDIVLLTDPHVLAGWFGFNAGSALAANVSATQAFATTQYATATGMLMWSILEVVFGGSYSLCALLAVLFNRVHYCRHGGQGTRHRPSNGCWRRFRYCAVAACCGCYPRRFVVAGAVVGLVAITPACGFVTIMWCVLYSGLSRYQSYTHQSLTL
jgi:ammonia channel protein AmtB